MTLIPALILFALTWWIVFFIVIQTSTDTQEETNTDIVPGTPKSAPSGEQVKRYALRASLFTIPFWALEVWLIG